MLSLDSLTSTCQSVLLMLPSPALPMTTASSGNRIIVPLKRTGFTGGVLHHSAVDLTEEPLGCLLEMCSVVHEVFFCFGVFLGFFFAFERQKCQKIKIIRLFLFCFAPSPGQA